MVFLVADSSTGGLTASQATTRPRHQPVTTTPTTNHFSKHALTLTRYGVSREAPVNGHLVTDATRGGSRCPGAGLLSAKGWYVVGSRNLISNARRLSGDTTLVKRRSR